MTIVKGDVFYSIVALKLYGSLTVESIVSDPSIEAAKKSLAEKAIASIVESMELEASFISIINVILEMR